MHLYNRQCHTPSSGLACSVVWTCVDRSVYLLDKLPEGRYSASCTETEDCDPDEGWHGCAGQYTQQEGLEGQCERGEIVVFVCVYARLGVRERYTRYTRREG